MHIDDTELTRRHIRHARAAGGADPLATSANDNNRGTPSGSRRRQTGDAIALRLQHAGQPDVAISYRDLLRSSMAFANLYARKGLAPGKLWF